MVTPAAAAYLLTDNLPRMIALAVGIGVASAISGYWLAHAVDVNIAGAMATMTGVVFLVVFLAAPERGMVARWRRHARQKWEFAQVMLTITPDAARRRDPMPPRRTAWTICWSTFAGSPTLPSVWCAMQSARAQCGDKGACCI